MKNLLGFCEWSFPVKGERAFQLSAQLGADVIQIDDLGGKRSSFPLSDKAKQEEYLEYSEKYGVRICSIGANAFAKSGELVLDIDSFEGKAAIETLKVYLKFCADMCVPSMMIPYFWRSYITDADIEKRRNAAKFMRLAGRMAEDSGIILGFESILSAENSMEIVSGANSKNVKLFFDSQNSMHFTGADPSRELKYYGKENIVMLHVKDGDAETIGNKVLGDGVTDVLKTLGIIREIGYEGCIIIENEYDKAPFCETEEDVLRNADYDISLLRKF